jgi:hypothetical protein
MFGTLYNVGKAEQALRVPPNRQSQGQVKSLRRALLPTGNLCLGKSGCAAKVRVESDINMSLSKVHPSAFRHRATGDGPGSQRSSTGTVMQADSPDRSPGVRSRLSDMLEDEALAEDLSAYLDGTLKGEKLAHVQSLMDADPLLAKEVFELRSVSDQLKMLGADILDEPVPEALIATLRKNLRRS